MTDQEILKLLERDRDRGVEQLFRQYYKLVYRTVLRILANRTAAEDVAQEVFLELWRKRERITVSSSLPAYLRRAARNRALNYIRDQKLKFDDRDEGIIELPSGATTVNQKLAAEELQQRIDTAIEALPERCRIVFALSRFEDMSYREIAEELDISIKTVENQISKALRLLRSALGDYLP